jgi:L-alanine-DL-glutamate epimerase-like enolase superfamily enzyme
MHQLLVEDLITAPDLTPVQGKLAMPDDRPGLGFELNWDAVERSQELYQRNPFYHHS